MPERRPAPRPRASFGSTFGLIVAVVTLAAAVAFFALRDTNGSEAPLLCDGLATAGTAYLLLDLRKPMAPGVSATATREVARRVPAGTELAVYAVGHDPRTPRHHVGRLCRPYDDDVLQVTTAKDGGTTPRDCDNLPAQISPALRAAATTYCGERSTLARRVDTLNAAAAPRVADAYLVEAIAESVGDLAAAPAPRTLYVHSDMLQHAPWYSHLDLDWPEWVFEDFAAIPDTGPASRRPDVPAGLRVRVLYVPRAGVTDAPRVQAAHWAFWRRYFDGADIAFEARAPLRAYAATPAMALDSALAAVAGERRATARRRQEAERELAAVNRQIEAVDAESRTLVGAYDDLAERVGALGRQLASTRSERHRLRTELDNRPVPAPEPPVVPEPPGLPEPPAVPEPRIVQAAACGVVLRPEFDTALTAERNLGDGAANHGAGRMVVRYAVDARGATLDGAAVDAERSSATRPEDFDVLAGDALSVVQGWRFHVDCGPGAAIGPQGQAGTATLNYRQKCVGAPIPRCRTVFSDAAY